MIASSDDEEFAELYRLYMQAVYGYCWNHLREQSAAEDATQQVFLRAWQAWPRYRDCGAARSWLCSIAHNVLIDIKRKERPITSLHDAVAIPLEQRTEQAALGAIGAQGVESAIAALPSDMRAAVELRRFGLTTAEIAECLGISYEAAKKRLWRAIQLLRHALGLDGTEQGGRDGDR